MDDHKRNALWANQLLTEISKLEDNKGIEMLNSCGEACCKESELYSAAVKIRTQYPANEEIEVLYAAFKKQYYNNSRLRSGLTWLLI